MRFFHTYIHGIIDYFVCALLLAGPWEMGFVGNRLATWTFIAMGLLGLVSSLLTDYELGALRLLPMEVHLGIDFFSGAFLAASPWLLGFRHEVWLPHLCFGLLAILVAMFSQIVPGPRTGRPDHIPLR